MEILPPKEPNRKTNKRVRFDLPDEVNKVPLSDLKRRKSPDVVPNKKYRLRKPILRKVQPLVMPKRLGSTEQNLVVDDERLLTTTHNLSARQDSSGSDMIQEDTDLNDSVLLDKNENCVVRTDNCKSVKQSNFVLRKSKSVGMRCNGKRQLNGRCQKKRKVVISKKSRLKENSYTKHKRGRKRKRDDSCKSAVKAPKKRKLSDGKLKVGKNPPIERRKQQYKSKQCKNKSKRNASKVKRVQKGRSSKVKTIQKKVKKTADNLRKASKKGMQKSRYSERMKKATQKKLSLKQSSAKKRKVTKTKTKLNKNKVVSKRVNKKGRRRRRKIRIIKIDRELDVIEPLRVSLLKYLTFEEAYNSNLDCCRKYCWDDWEEIDMEDIIDDYD